MEASVGVGSGVWGNCDCGIGVVFQHVEFVKAAVNDLLQWISTVQPNKQVECWHETPL